MHAANRTVVIPRDEIARSVRAAHRATSARVARLTENCRLAHAHFEGDASFMDSVRAVFGVNSRAFRLCERYTKFRVLIAHERAWRDQSIGLYSIADDGSVSSAALDMMSNVVERKGRARVELPSRTRNAMLNYLRERAALIDGTIALIESAPYHSQKQESLSDLRRERTATEKLVKLISFD